MQNERIERACNEYNRRIEPTLIAITAALKRRARAANKWRRGGQAHGQ